MFAWILGHFFATCIGISLGLIGGGGSVLAVPILVYVMGVAPKPAIAMTLFIVGCVSLIGVIPHWQQGNVKLKTAFIFGSTTMLGAYVGAKLATLPFISGTIQMILFALMMLLAAGFMIKKSAKPLSKAAVHDLSLYPKPICKYCWLWMLSEGLGVGLLTGLVGVGGGFAIVPALVLLGNTPMKQAIGTSLLIIAMNSVAGLLGYLGQVSINWHLVTSFTVAASLGILIGAYFSQFVNPRQLQRGFGYLLIAVASFILFQNRSKFSSYPSPVAYTTQQEQHHQNSRSLEEGETPDSTALAHQIAQIKALLTQKNAIAQTPSPIKIDLTPREQSVLDLVAAGLMNKEIARRLQTSVRNVEKYVSRLFSKTGTNSRTELVRFALEHGLAK